MPCLNEAETLATCIKKARRCLDEHGVKGEIIVADNGSTDGSPDIARALGARVVPVSARGYGNALMGGIAAARGRFVIMGDADDSYDFTALHPFIEKLRGGAEMAQGCRLPSGGGRVMEGAMPPSHRWLGNPMFSVMARRMFDAPVHDVYCGLRGFTKALYERLDLRCTGMEFAIEMIIKASVQGARIAEVPITLHPDGRTMHKSHLRTVRDGWRTLRFFLLCSPRWLFLLPGLALMAAGLAGYAVALPGATVSGVTFDAHTLLFASLALLAGFQSAQFAVFARTFAVNIGLLPEQPALARLLEFLRLERGLLIGVAAMLTGVSLLLGAVNQWRLAHFGQLDYAHTMRWVIPGVTLTSLGFQMMLFSFVLSILTLRRK
ncbi:MAG: glycosyltransferase family 2 protein [Verrucomicrobia bacterium]|nr:glycosyltransferase family 2 protein [Verrucomicrobiota bacterium]